MTPEEGVRWVVWCDYVQAAEMLFRVLFFFSNTILLQDSRLAGFGISFEIYKITIDVAVDDMSSAVALITYIC